MFSNQAARASVDSLPPLSPPHSRPEFPFHRYAPAVLTCPMPASLTAARLDQVPSQPVLRGDEAPPRVPYIPRTRSIR